MNTTTDADLSYEAGRKALLQTFLRRQANHKSQSVRRRRRRGGSVSPVQSPTRSQPQSPCGLVTIRDFTFVRCLSTGGSSEVWLAVGLSGHHYAIKVMDKRALRQSHNDRRAINERFVMSALMRSRYVVRLYRALVSQHKLYLVMEYMNGGDLAQYIAKNAPISAAECVKVVANCVAAIGALHRRRIIHRDIKPDNFVADENRLWKLTDFGLSIFTERRRHQQQHVHDDDDDRNNERDERARWYAAKLAARHNSNNKLFFSAVGSHDYVAPEHVLGIGHDYTCDYWSLGVMTFELLTGMKPFRAETIDLVHSNIIHRNIQWPTHIHLPLIARDFIERLLTVSIQQRLGARSGIREIKQHAFFEGYQWKHDVTLHHDSDSAMVSPYSPLDVPSDSDIYSSDSSSYSPSLSSPVSSENSPSLSPSTSPLLPFSASDNHFSRARSSPPQPQSPLSANAERNTSMQPSSRARVTSSNATTDISPQSFQMQYASIPPPNTADMKSTTGNGVADMSSTHSNTSDPSLIAHMSMNLPTVSAAFNSTTPQTTTMTSAIQRQMRLLRLTIADSLCTKSNPNPPQTTALLGNDETHIPATINAHRPFPDQSLHSRLTDRRRLTASLQLPSRSISTPARPLHRSPPPALTIVNPRISPLAISRALCNTHTSPIGMEEAYMTSTEFSSLVNSHQESEEIVGTRAMSHDGKSDEIRSEHVDVIEHVDDDIDMDIKDEFAVFSFNTRRNK